MRHLIKLILLIALGASFAPVSASEEEKPPPLDCMAGPLHKSYGGTNWLIYACDDSRSIVVVSEPGSPAAPFVFILNVKPDRSMKISGEGNGEKSATQAAFDELKLLSHAEVEVLHSQAQAIGVSDN